MTFEIVPFCGEINGRENTLGFEVYRLNSFTKERQELVGFFETRDEAMKCIEFLGKERIERITFAV